MGKIILLSVIAFFTSSIVAQNDSSIDSSEKDTDISFFVIGKSPLYLQNDKGELTYEKHYLFGEIFLKAGGDLKSAKLLLPKGSREEMMEFNGKGLIWKVERQDFKSIEELNSAYPDGDYQFIIETKSGAHYEETVNLNHLDSLNEPSKPVSIYLYQNDRLIKNTEIDPECDLVVRWSPFTNGHQDPNGICDDLIFAMCSDCNGDFSFARSALPFEHTPALTYNDNEFRIPADRLQAGSYYNLLVEHAPLVQTFKTESGVIGLATYPTVTKTVFHTTGPINSNCLPKTK